MYENIVCYAKLNHFLRVICIYMTRQLNEKHVLKYQACFNTIDKSENGLLSMQEFVDAGGNCGQNKQVLMDVFDALDIHKNKVLTYTQFVSGGLPVEIFQMEDNMKIAFKFFDHDRDGTLTKIDLQNFINYEYPGMLDTAYGKKMLSEFDHISGGQGIQYPKFAELVKTIGQK